MILKHNEMPGCEEAFVGIGRKGGVTFLVYDHDLIISALEKRGIPVEECQRIAIGMADEQGMSATAPVTVMRLSFAKYEALVRISSEDEKS